MADLEEIADLLARAKQYAGTIPDGDVRARAVVGPIDLLCDGITTAVAFVNLPGHSAVTVAEWNGRIATMMAQLEGWLVRGEAFGLAQEVGRARAAVQARSAKGAAARAVKLKKKGDETRANVKALEAQLRAAGVPERSIVKKIAAALKLSVDTVRDHRK